MSYNHHRFWRQLVKVKCDMTKIRVVTDPQSKLFKMIPDFQFKFSVEHPETNFILYGK